MMDQKKVLEAACLACMTTYNSLWLLVRDRDNLVGDVQLSTIHISAQDLDIFQFKRVHLLTKDKTIFIGAWFFKVKAMKHVQQGTHGVMGRQPEPRAFLCKIRVESLPLSWRRLFGRLS